MKHVPCLDIYRKNGTNEIMILNFAVRPIYGGNIAWGKVVNLTLENVQDGGAEIILANLRGFSERDGSQGSDLPKLSREQQRKFDRNHTLVGVRQESLSQLILTPMHRASPAGFTGERSEEIIVELPCSSEEFAKKLDTAFEKAG